MWAILMENNSYVRYESAPGRWAVKVFETYADAETEAAQLTGRPLIVVW